MDPLVGGLLLDVARRIGTPIVKGLLERYVGGAAGEIGGAIIDAVADRVGVPSAELPSQDPKQLENAVRDVEAAAPEILVQWNVQQAQAIALQKAEMDKGGAAWTWAWRPGGMWLMLGLVPFYAAFVPLVDLFLALMGAGPRLSAMLILSVGAFIQLFMFYAGFYMGGHTVKDAFAKWSGRGS